MSSSSDNAPLLIAFLLVVLLVAGVAGVVWFVNGKEADEGVVATRSLLVKAAEADSPRVFVVTPFLVVQNGSIVAKGVTRSDGVWEEILIPDVSGGVYVINYEEGGLGGGYYNGRVKINNVEGASPTMKMHRVGGVSVEVYDFDSENVWLNVSVVGNQYRQLGYCLKGSLGFLDVVGEHPFVDVPTFLSGGDWDSCHASFITLDVDQVPSSLLVRVGYRVASSALFSYDRIDLAVFDSTRNWEGDYTFEGADGSDIGGETFLYRLDSGFFIEELGLLKQ